MKLKAKIKVAVILKRRFFFSILSALSLLLWLGVVVLWVRSYQVDDCLTMRAPSNHQGYTQVMIDSGAGSSRLTSRIEISNRIVIRGDRDTGT